MFTWITSVSLSMRDVYLSNVLNALPTSQKALYRHYDAGSFSVFSTVIAVYAENCMKRKYTVWAECSF
jgi:hypothetical protein